MPNRPVARAFASSFGIGFFPFLPGTVASVIGVFLYLLVFRSLFLYGGSVFFVFVVGLFASRRSLQTTTEKDPSWIVIDEVLGMMLSLFLIPPRIPFLIFGFILFRFFDSIKAWPLDRLELLHGEWGILLDDVGAGIYANLILQIVLRATS